MQTRLKKKHNTNGKSTKPNVFSSGNNKWHGADKDTSGNYKDERKGKLFAISEDEIDTKTELAGLAQTVFADRYARKDAEGKAAEKYPEQMWLRVARGIAQFEKDAKLQKSWEQKFYKLMKDFKYVPGGRILSGAGTGYEVTFFNCYVIPSPTDSRGGIMESVTHTVEMQARGGGVGLNLSSLRPRGARVRKVNGTSSGPVNWASLYSTANHDVIQQGGSRRGALMLMLNDWHPDVEEFIRVKEDLTKIPGANLSVCVSDSFMEAVKNDAEWELVFPDMTDPEYDEKWRGDIDNWKALGKKLVVHKTVKAKDVWNMICEAAWRSAEPGLHFLERSNTRSNTWYFEKLVATNPCGEQPLGPWAVCNLGAMNLSAYVKNEEFDFESLGEDVRVAMRFMDNVVDANFYFYEENRRSQEGIRRTGLGTMGLGDALIKMKVRYGSDESITIIEKIYRTIRDNAYDTSADLAAEKGAFPNFNKEKYLKGHFIERLPESVREKIAKHGIRNAVILTQAPTGTTSIISGVSSGIEPNYDFEFKRSDRTGEHVVYHPLWKDWREANPDAEKPEYFVTSNDLTPEDHVRIQAKIQEFTDSSISKTVNAPEHFTVEDVQRLYMLAYDLGCKGVTFFRDGSRKGVLERVSDKKEKEETNGNGHTEVPAAVWVRPMRISGATYKLQTPVGTAFVTINEGPDGNPVEVFINIGKAGSDVAAMAEAMGRVISKSLKFDGSLKSSERAMVLVDQLRGIGGRTSVGFGPTRVRSLPDAISIALATHCGLKANGNGVANEASSQSKEEVVQASFLQVDDDEHKMGADICPECGKASLVSEEGCAKCHNCGHSEC